MVNKHDEVKLIKITNIELDIPVISDSSAWFSSGIIWMEIEHGRIIKRNIPVGERLFFLACNQKFLKETDFESPDFKDFKDKQIVLEQFDESKIRELCKREFEYAKEKNDWDYFWRHLENKFVLDD